LENNYFFLIWRFFILRQNWICVENWNWYNISQLLSSFIVLFNGLCFTGKCKKGTGNGNWTWHNMSTIFIFFLVVFCSSILLTDFLFLVVCTSPWRRELATGVEWIWHNMSADSFLLLLVSVLLFLFAYLSFVGCILPQEYEFVSEMVNWLDIIRAPDFFSFFL